VIDVVVYWEEDAIMRLKSAPAGAFAATAGFWGKRAREKNPYKRNEPPGKLRRLIPQYVQRWKR